MTQDDYTIVANAIGRVYLSTKNETGQAYIREVALSLAESFKLAKPSFSSEKFFAACGWNILDNGE